MLAWAPLQVCGSRAQSQISLPVSTEEGGLWVELVGDPERPVSSLTQHFTRRALRWADAALRAERAPRGLAPRATAADWAALAVIAWQECRADWEAARGSRLEAGQSAAETTGTPALGPACLAEVLNG